MHVLFLADYIDQLGGIERGLSARANYLVREKGCHVTIVCLQKHTGQPAYELDPAIDLHIFEPLDSATSMVGRVALRMKQAHRLIAFRPDVIISVKFTLHNLYLRIFSRNIGLISEIRESKAQYDERGSSSLLRPLMRSLRDWVFRHQDALIVLTETSQREWGFANTVVIPNALYVTKRQRKEVKQERVLAVGRLSPVKGYDRLLSAWKLVIDSAPDWTLRICGGGEDRERLLRRIRELDLHDSVELPGPVAEVSAEYLEAAIFVHCAREEVFGNVLIEAMHFGLPVVAFDVAGGPRTLVANEETGYLVPDGNVVALAERIVFLIRKSGVRAAMGAKGKLFSRNFYPDRIHPLYYKTISEVNAKYQQG